MYNIYKNIHRFSTITSPDGMLFIALIRNKRKRITVSKMDNLLENPLTLRKPEVLHIKPLTVQYNKKNNIKALLSSS